MGGEDGWCRRLASVLNDGLRQRGKGILIKSMVMGDWRSAFQSPFFNYDLGVLSRLERIFSEKH